MRKYLTAAITLVFCSNFCYSKSDDSAIFSCILAYDKIDTNNVDLILHSSKPKICSGIECNEVFKYIRENRLNSTQVLPEVLADSNWNYISVAGFRVAHNYRRPTYRSVSFEIDKRRQRQIAYQAKYILYSISSPYYLNDSTQCVIYVSSSVAETQGGSCYYHLIKDGDKWHVVSLFGCKVSQRLVVYQKCWWMLTY